jgi:23S rRNA pseudouridine2605 synthase
VVHHRTLPADTLTSAPADPGAPANNAQRLQKLLSRAGHGSRRACEKLIAAGRVTVDGKVATLGQRADPATQTIEVDGQSLTLPTTNVTILLNKPNGYVVSAKAENDIPSVYDLIPTAPPQIRYVGRLDVNSEGVLLFSTDGDLVYRLTHPRFEVDKVYEAVVEGIPDSAALEQLRTGVTLDDGLTAPATVDLIDRRDDESVVRLTIHEGRKRQIRRMLGAVGHPVRRLRRVAVGPITLGTLERAASRELTADELSAIRRLVGLDVAAAEAGTR